jgi:Uma2 family endonuclease
MVQPLVADGAAPRGDHRAYDNVVLIHGATWADYQRLLELRGESAVPRITFLEGLVEIMSPSRVHESKKSMIGRLVEAWCFARGVEITPYGSWTLESKRSERGAEPDECYVVGDDDDPERPHLAIEVVHTSGGINRLEVYRKLGVREIWFWRKGRFELHALRGEHYEAIAESEVLRGIDLTELAGFVDMKPMTRAVRAYRKALGG